MEKPWARTMMIVGMMIGTVSIGLIENSSLQDILDYSVLVLYSGFAFLAHWAYCKFT